MHRAPRLSAVALLVGFYVLAFLVLAAAAGLTLLAWTYADWAALKVTLVALPVAWPVARSVLATLPDDEPAGVRVGREEQPLLWAEVEDLAAALGTRPPDEIWLDMEPNAGVSERSRLLGLVGGPSRLQLGLPLAACLSVAELRAVLAHELGHLGAGHTQLGRIAYRGLSSVWMATSRLDGTLTGIVFRAYAKLYARVSMGFSRRDELEADAAAARLGGAPVLAAALERLGPVQAAWDLLLDDYLGIGLDASLVPADPIAGLRALLAEPGRSELLHHRAASEAVESPFDSHPPLAARLAALGVEPGRGDGAYLSLPATSALDVLVADPGPTLAAARDQWYARKFEDADLDPAAFVLADWDTLVARSFPGISERVRETVTAAAGDVAADALPPLSHDARQGLDLVVELLAHGRGVALAARLVETPEKVVAADAEVRGVALEVCAEAVYLAIAGVAVRERGGEWRTSWAECALAELADGTVVDLRPSLREALADPAATESLRAKLDELGIDLRDDGLDLPAPRSIPEAEIAADARTRPPALGAVPMVRMRRRVYDMVMFRDACVLVPLTFWKKYRHSFVGQLGIVGPTNRRLTELSSRPYAELVARNGVSIIRVRDVLLARASTGMSGTKLSLSMVDGSTIQLGLLLTAEDQATAFAVETFGAMRVEVRA